MKIEIKTPEGTEFHYESRPLSEERFEAVCCVAVVMSVLLFLYGIFTLVT